MFALARVGDLVKGGRALHPLVKILLYLAVVVLVGAILSPPLFWLLDGTINFPFYRYFSRTAQVTGPTPGMKLLQRNKKIELYDLTNDEAEKNDLSNDDAKLAPIRAKFDAAFGALDERKPLR